MIIDFRVKNFRSFNEQTSLSLMASQQTTLNDNLIRWRDLRILPSAVIYGANAGGKSNLILAMEIMQEIVRSGSIDSNQSALQYLELYPFAYGDENMPMGFEMEFVSGDNHFVYGFELAMIPARRNTREIVSEFLSIISNNQAKTKIPVYSRKGQQVEINTSSKVLKLINIEKKLLNLLLKRINQNVDSSELFLSRGFKSTISSDLADSVLDFFENQLVVVRDFSLMKTKISFQSDDNRADIVYLWNKLLEGFIKQADFGPQVLSYRTNKTNDDNSGDAELVALYNYQPQGEKVLIPAEITESRGTLKLIDFVIPFGEIFRQGGVLVLDEFDASIHPELIKGILSLFNNAAVNEKAAQLIFTTHNPIYLNNQIFRRDQIRFVEKDSESFESIIYSLADFGSEEVRNDHNHLIRYFKGDYGALPFYDFSVLLREPEEAYEED